VNIREKVVKKNGYGRTNIISLENIYKNYCTICGFMFL